MRGAQPKAGKEGPQAQPRDAVAPAVRPRGLTGPTHELKPAVLPPTPWQLTSPHPWQCPLPSWGN